MTERTQEELVEEIQKVFDEKISPSVAQDGGDVEFVKFENGVVYVEMKGACVGCPSSTMTLKYGIENMLRFFFPEVTRVEDIGGEEMDPFGPYLWLDSDFDDDGGEDGA